MYACMHACMYVCHMSHNDLCDSVVLGSFFSISLWSSLVLGSIPLADHHCGARQNRWPNLTDGPWKNEGKTWEDSRISTWHEKPEMVHWM